MKSHAERAEDARMCGFFFSLLALCSGVTSIVLGCSHMPKLCIAAALFVIFFIYVAAIFFMDGNRHADADWRATFGDRRGL